VDVALLSAILAGALRLYSLTARSSSVRSKRSARPQAVRVQQPDDPHRRIRALRGALTRRLISPS
jgi:hypothetical protein